MTPIVILSSACDYKSCELASLLTLDGLSIFIPLKGGSVIKLTKKQTAFGGRTSIAEWYGITKKKVGGEKKKKKRG